MVEIKLFGGGSLLLPPIHITIILIIMTYLYVRLCNKLGISKMKTLLYFVISTIVIPVYSHSSENGLFHLWVPIGFIFIAIYLIKGKTYHPSKLVASLLGLAFAIYQMFEHYFPFINV